MLEYETYIKEKRLEGYGLWKDEIYLRKAYRRAEIQQRRKASSGKDSRVKHLKENNMSWSLHLWYAMTLVGKLLLLSLTALVHGLLPFMFTSTASNGIKRLSDDLDKRNNT